MQRPSEAGKFIAWGAVSFPILNFSAIKAKNNAGATFHCRGGGMSPLPLAPCLYQTHFLYKNHVLPSSLVPYCERKLFDLSDGYTHDKGIHYIAFVFTLESELYSLSLLITHTLTFIRNLLLLSGFFL